MPRRPVPSAAPRLPELARRANPRRAGDAAPRPAPDAGTRRCARSVPARGGRLHGFQNPASGSRPQAATRAAQKRPARQAGPEKCCRRYAARPRLPSAPPIARRPPSRQQNLSRQHMQINKGGLLPGQRTYEFRHVLRRVEHEHARRLAIQPETVGQPLPPGTGGQLQVGRRCGPRNRQCHAIGDEPASRRIRPQGLHGLGARAGQRASRQGQRRGQRAAAYFSHGAEA